MKVASTVMIPPTDMLTIQKPASPFKTLELRDYLPMADLFAVSSELSNLDHPLCKACAAIILQDVDICIFDSKKYVKKTVVIPAHSFQMADYQKCIVQLKAAKIVDNDTTTLEVEISQVVAFQF